jgi:hypothetical protein
MGGFKGRRGIQKNRSQLLALLTSTCIALTSQSLATQTALAQSKSTVEFNIKPTDNSAPMPTVPQQGEPIRISLPSAVPPSASTALKQNATLPTMLPPGLPAAAASQPTTVGVSGLPSNAPTGKVQMRLSSEEPPKLPISVTSPKNEVVRLNITSEQPVPLAPPSQSTKKQAAVQKPEGPVKFNVGDAGVKDFGIQGTSITPPSLSRAPELVKPKKYSVSQTVVLARSTEISDGSSVQYNRQEVMPPEVHGQGVVKQTISDARSDFSNDTVSQENPMPSGLVSLTKPSKPRGSSDRNFLGLASNSMSNSSGTNGADVWRGAEVEREYDIEIMGTYSIDVPFEIARIETQDPECCGVFNNGRAITVVGKNQGHTKVAVISKDQQRRVVGVKVLPTGQQTSTPKSDLEQVKEMIANLFPDANLTFSNQDSGSIEIRGTTKSEGEARKVLELVRRICLVPIEDKVKVLP